MGLEFDTLKYNEMSLVVYNNTNGSIAGFGYTLKDFLGCLFDNWRVAEHQVKKYFNREEIEDFFSDNDVKFDSEELDKLFVEGDD